MLLLDRGAEVSILPISGRASGSDQVIEASLLDAGEKASELGLLRTVASGLGIVWGRDDLGAWAMVPNEEGISRDILWSSRLDNHTKKRPMMPCLL